jgi:mannose-1-phosphate guanylyltransferase
MDVLLARQEPAGVSGPNNGAGRVHGIVLAGTYNWSAFGLDALTPRPLLPVAQSALITYPLRWLRDGGVADATVCTNGPSRDVQAYLGDGAWLRLALAHHEDATPRGTAGSARDASLGTDAQTLVITEGTCIPAVDIGQLLEEHRRQGAALTVVVHPEREPGLARRPLNPDGLYVMERRALEFVPAAGFQDMKENLIPRLYRAGERVVTYRSERRSPRVINANTYLSVNHWAVRRLRDMPQPVESWGDVPTTGDLIAHPTASVHPSARVLGPVLLGPRVCVQADATLVGPASLGADCAVEKGAMVSRSVAWNRCRVGAAAVVDGCVLTDGTLVRAGQSLFHALKVPAPAGRLFEVGRAAGASRANAVREAMETIDRALSWR